MARYDIADKAAEIQAFVDSQEAATKPLRDKWERYHRLWRLECLPFDKASGDYEMMYVNKPRVYSDKVTEELANSAIKYSIPVYKDNKADREKCSMTEQAVYGLMNTANEYYMDATTPSIQAVTAWFIANQGMVVRRVIVWTDEDDTVVPDVAVWNARNGYWLKGKRGLRRYCNVRWDSAESISDEYGVDVSGKDDNIQLYDDWQVVGGKCVETITAGGIVLDEIDWTARNPILTYIPINIVPVGNVPFIQIQGITDTIKDVGQTVYDRNEEIWKIESRLLSYELTNIANSTHTPFMNIFDSSKGGTAVNLSANPYKTGAEIPVDEGKGQALKPFFQPVEQSYMQRLKADIAGMEARGAAPDIFYGNGGESATAQGTQLLINAAMAVLKAGQRALEQSESWTANELIRQIKNTKDDLSDLQVQGADGKGHQFATKIKIKDLVDDRRIICTAKIENPLGDLQNMGLASEAIKSKILSKQTVLDKVLGLDDPDAELEAIDREEAENNTGVKLRHLQKALIDDGDEVGAAYIAGMLKQFEQQLMAQLQGGGQPPTNTQPPPMAGNQAATPGIPTPQPVQANVGNQGPSKQVAMARRVMRG